MKKIISLLLCIVVALPLFSCGGSELSVDTEETVTEEKKTEKKSEEKKTSEKKTEEEKTEEKKTEERKLEPIKHLPNITVYDDPTRLESYIKKFDKEKIETGGILFYGHSHYTRWVSPKESGKGDSWAATESLRDMIVTPKGNKPCINHGFGSSNSYDLCYYYERAVRPWAPNAIVITTCLNAGQLQDGQQLICIEWLINQINIDFPDCKIFITDYPPIIKTSKSLQSRLDFNEQVRKICKEAKNATMIELSKDKRLYTDAKDVGTYANLNPDLYWPADNVHFSVKGYEVMAKIYQEALKDILAQYDK